MPPIRVLHILHSMNRGGAENAIMNYYRHINRDLVQFDFLLTEPEKCQFEDEIISLGGRVYRIPLLTIGNPIPYLKSIKRFYKSHPEYRIVHSHTSSKSTFPLWMAKRMGIPVRIAHSHGSHSEKGFSGIIRNLLKTPLKYVANHYLACGIEAAKWLYGKKTYDTGHVIIIPNILECSKFVFDIVTRDKVRQQLNISRQTIVLGCTARFFYPKNQSFVIDIFAKFHEMNEKSFLILVGDGEDRPFIEKKIIHLGLEKNILITGVTPRVTEYEQAMDIFLMPSFFEGMPLSLLEAQISGLPCFVSTGVPKEADKTGLVHFLPLEKGAKYWAEYILTHNNYERKSHLKELIDAGYDAETSAKKLQDFYIAQLSQVDCSSHEFKN